MFVCNNLPVARPHQSNGLCSPDPRSSRITRRPKPVVLRCTRGARPDPRVAGAVHSVGKDLSPEFNVIGHHGGGEVVLHSLADLEHQVNVTVLVCGDHLERTEHLVDHNVKMRQELVQRYVDSGRLPVAVLLGNLGALQRLPTADQPGPRNLQDLVQESKKLLVAPGDHRAHREVSDISSLGQLHQLTLQSCLRPVLVHEQSGLGGALLPTVGVCILVAGERDVVEALARGGDVGAQDLPVKTCILNADLSPQVQCELLRHLAATCELRHTRLRSHQEIVGDSTPCIQEVDVCLRQPTMVQQVHPLLHHGGLQLGDLQCWSVPHVQGPHQLQHRDFQWEIKRRHNSHPSKRPTVPDRLLPGVVA
mmetsp:Transcript_8290/g.19846  ORF Transcript_8290/g.19846 Transcript_8290/m.19846 type:complete len:364 (+) Transcript_8290:295-1386(+)